MISSKKLARTIFPILLTVIGAPSMAQVYGRPNYPQPILVPQVAAPQSPCEMVAVAITYEIEAAEANRSQPEKSSRYQALKQDRQLGNFNIPALLSTGMQTRMDGADFGDVFGAVRAKCNANSRN